MPGMAVHPVVETDLRFRALRPLIGRESDLARLRERLGSSRLVTVTGPGGVGKTSLVAAIAVERGAPIVDLSAVRTVELATAEIAVVVGADPESSDPAVDRIARAVGGGARLLVLDNLEQIAGVADLIGDLLLAALHLSIVATSRRPTGLTGEAIVPLEPLAVPADSTARAVEDSPAAALFLALGRYRGHEESLDPASAAEIADLVRQLDGLPLAIELAAARLPLYSPGAILRHLASGSDAFLKRTTEGRHGSLGAALDWSMDLLDPADRDALLDLSVIPSTFDSAMGTAVIGRPDGESILGTLVADGLVAARRGTDGEPRFYLLETIRSSCQDRQSVERRDAAAARLTGFVAEVVTRFGTASLLAVTSDVRCLTPVSAAIRTVLEWSVAHDPDAGLDVAMQCGDLWHARGADADGLDWIVRLLDAGPTDAPTVLRGRASLARTLWTLGRIDEALAAAELVVPDAAGAGDVISEACALYVAIGALSERGQHEAAERHLRRLRTLGDAARTPHLGLWQRRAEAIVAEMRGDLAPAVAANAALAEEAAAAGFPALEALARANSVDPFLLLGRPDEARRQAERAVSLYEATGPWTGIGWPLALLARACARLGDRDAARAALLRAIAGAREHENAVVVASTLEAALSYYVAFGDPTLGCRAFGAIRGGGFASGPAVTEILDRVAEPDLARARQRIGAVNVEAAIVAGAGLDPSAILVEIERGLEGDEHAPAAPLIRLRHGDLSPREVDVLRLLADGRADREIGEALFISPKTASVHVSTIKEKLGVRTRVEAVIRARELLGAETRDA